jgi:protein tyrosine/serine phosphatase
MLGGWRSGLALALMALIVAIPAAYYRAGYAHAKRLRVVAEGKVYRSGQLTAEGFREAVRRYGIRTIINLQEEARDPLIPERWQQKATIRESELCQQLGVRYIALDGGVLDQPNQPVGGQPKVVREFLEILDNQAAYPILFHCKAGLHRTGLIAAIYRMECEGWSRAAAVRELRANGFGNFAATDGNVYLQRFILDFQPSERSRPKNAATQRGAN